MAKKILLIDDDVDLVDANKMALESKGYDVITAYDGKNGLEMARYGSPDLIVLDVMMGDQTEGFHVAKEIRSYEELKTIPVIMLSGVREEMDMKFKIEPDEDFLPITEFVEKPFPPGKLVEKIEGLLK